MTESILFLWCGKYWASFAMVGLLHRHL